jgi:hypothetical protein
VTGDKVAAPTLGLAQMSEREGLMDREWITVDGARCIIRRRWKGLPLRTSPPLRALVGHTAR